MCEAASKFTTLHRGMSDILFLSIEDERGGSKVSQIILLVEKLFTAAIAVVSQAEEGGTHFL